MDVTKASDNAVVYSGRLTTNDSAITNGLEFAESRSGGPPRRGRRKRRGRERGREKGREKGQVGGLGSTKRAKGRFGRLRERWSAWGPSVDGMNEDLIVFDKWRSFSHSHCRAGPGDCQQRCDDTHSRHQPLPADRLVCAAMACQRTFWRGDATHPWHKPDRAWQRPDRTLFRSLLRLLRSAVRSVEPRSAVGVRRRRWARGLPSGCANRAG